MLILFRSVSLVPRPLEDYLRAVVAVNAEAVRLLSEVTGTVVFPEQLLPSALCDVCLGVECLV